MMSNDLDIAIHNFQVFRVHLDGYLLHQSSFSASLSTYDFIIGSVVCAYRSQSQQYGNEQKFGSMFFTIVYIFIC